MTDNQTLPINNSAERLFVILTRASKAVRGETIIKVLSEVMEVEDNPDTFIKNSGKLLELIDIIEEDIKNKFPERKQRSYIPLLNDIRNKLIPTINHGLGKSRWENALGLNDSNWITLQSFEACVHDFEEYGVSIDKNSLNDLIKDVESLIKDVDESDLNDNFKKCVIFELRKIKDTLEKYYYYGAAEVKKEIYSALVEIGMIQVKNEDEKQKEKRKNIIEFLFKLVGAGSSLLNIKEKLPPTIAQGTDFITNLLPPGN